MSNYIPLFDGDVFTYPRHNPGLSNLCKQSMPCVSYSLFVTVLLENETIMIANKWAKGILYITVVTDSLYYRTNPTAATVCFVKLTGAQNAILLHRNIEQSTPNFL